MSRFVFLLTVKSHAAISLNIFIVNLKKAIIMEQVTYQLTIKKEYASAILEDLRLNDAIEFMPESIPLWQQIVSRYHPSFLVECVQAISWSKTMVGNWLLENMFKDEESKEETVTSIITRLSDHAETATHARHLSLQTCQELKLKIVKLEDDNVFQDLVLTVHHAYMHTFSMSAAIKITENHLGVATVLMGNFQQPTQVVPR